MSEERGGPSREEWNFPQVYFIYVGLAGPYTDERIIGKSDWLLINVSPLILCLSCYLSICCLFQYLRSLLCLLHYLSSHTLDVLLCVQEKKALAGLEGKSGYKPYFPLYYPPSPPPPLPWWHSFFFPWWESRTIVDKAESQAFLLK